MRKGRGEGEGNKGKKSSSSPLANLSFVDGIDILADLAIQSDAKQVES